MGTVDALELFAKGIRGTRSSAEWARAFTAGTSVKSNARHARVTFRPCVDCGCSCAFCKAYPRHKIPSPLTTAPALFFYPCNFGSMHELPERRAQGRAQTSASTSAPKMSQHLFWKLFTCRHFHKHRR